jgi:hypothetical protein
MLRNETRVEATVPVELFVWGKLRNALLKDLSINGALLEIPLDLQLAPGELVLIRPYGFASAAGKVRWSSGNEISIQFLHALHSTVVELAVNEYTGEHVRLQPGRELPPDAKHAA